MSFTSALPASDAVLKSAGALYTQGVSETIHLLESLDVLGPHTAVKMLTELTTLSEFASKEVSKAPITESVSLNEAISKTLSKTFLESLTLAGVLAKTSIKSPSESISLNEVLGPKEISHILAEALTLEDLYSRESWCASVMDLLKNTIARIRKVTPMDIIEPDDHNLLAMTYQRVLKYIEECL